MDLSALDEGNEARGNLRADYDNGIDIVTIGARVRF